MKMSVFDAKRVFDLAARGNAEAQELLHDAALHMSAEPPELSILQAEIWIRMAASQGAPTARLKLGTLLSARAARWFHEGNVPDTVEALAEAMAVYDRLAEEGDAAAVVSLERLLEATEIENLRDDVVRRSNEMRAEMLVHG